MNDLSILFVEDEDIIRESLIEFIKTFSSNVFIAKNGQEGLDLFYKNKIDIVISDIKMPVMSGVEMVRKIKKLHPQPYIIFTTAHNEINYMSEAIDMQVDGYLLKPIDFDKLKNKLNHIIELINLRCELAMHEMSHPNMDLKNTMFVTLGKNQNILHANDEFLSFFNIKRIDEFYHKYGFLNSVFVKKSGCFYPRENKSWINDFRRIKKNKRSFIALFDETNDKLQIVVAHIYDMNDGLSIGISFKKVDSLDYFKEMNNENILLECMTAKSKENIKKLFQAQLEKNEYSSIKVITSTINSDNPEVLNELSININNNIRDTDSLKRHSENNFSFVVVNISSKHALKLADRLKDNLFTKSLKGEIKVIDIDSDEAIERAFR